MQSASRIIFMNFAYFCLFLPEIEDCNAWAIPEVKPNNPVVAIDFPPERCYNRS